MFSFILIVYLPVLNRFCVDAYEIVYETVSLNESFSLFFLQIAALLCQIGALRSFSLEKLQYWRERASGMSSLAYFLARDSIDHFNTLIKPILYLSMFYFFNNPRSSIGDNYIILVSLVYCVTGIGYAFAIFFQPGSAQLVCPISSFLTSF